MKTRLLGLVLLFLASGHFVVAQNKSKVELFLASIDGVDYEKTSADSISPETYTLYIDQYIDHQDAKAGQFTQKLYLTHLNDSLPTVMVTEGYGAGGNFYSEPARIIGANQIIVEHRYFGESAPDSMNWAQLNTANAAADHHHVYNTFSKFYKNHWISTGISKGGQTSIFYKYYYPEDMHISMPYVAPLNLEQEDVRINWFLRHVATPEEDAIILNYQRLMLQNFDKIFPKFKAGADKNEQKFAINDTAAYEFMVLEFPFSYFQWGSLELEDIPKKYSRPKKMMKPMFDLGLVSFYFESTLDELMPFMVQAYRELGYYDYDLDSLQPYLRKVENSSNIAFVPEELRFEYDAEIMNEVYDFIHNEGNRMIYVYGELDPWSSTSVNPDSRVDAIKLVLSGGSHSTRIRHFTEEQQKMIKEQLEKWLQND
ncbi:MULTISPECIES: S28 family serine protease [unclassified Lentimicrobium]|uniref:S28 family serine protease n=1 Tax=unclassified Lentimicrobium TaxID=2677434 RepID=UPI00155495C3|nr:MULTISPECIES: S28 family serine protease [unclassified Lentimicrobium]NPD46512.1 hypothetical protein [Lentimicrobium sp. S6]NPD85161.1 hypothetical protein [Lentimicrobium sp. L6]